MKNWTQFIGVSEPNDTLSLPINKHQYEQIQKDALRLAARIANNSALQIGASNVIMAEGAQIACNNILSIIK